MSRFKRFAHSLASGYVLLGANILYTLASVPLALRYLSKEEFGLWSLTTNIAQYVALVDFGMSGASRILIDHKDDKSGGSYGSLIQTFFLVSAVQGLLILAVGVGLAAGLAPLLKIPAAQEGAFVWLTIGQCALLAGSFLTRILYYLLAAHQRLDLNNYAQSINFGLGFGVLWLAFARGQGVYSTLWSLGATWVTGSVFLIGCVVKLKLLPGRGCWRRPTWRSFVELFTFARDVFLFALGFQLLNASQTLILTRGLGLEAAAIWSVCTRTYAVISQVIFRIFDYSGPALAEMIVRGERQLLYKRFKSLVVLSGSLSVVAGAGFAVCNQPFVHLWTGGKIGWAPLNDVLLAVWLVLLAVSKCHLGLVGQAKQFGAMRFLYLVEGGFFVGVSLLVLDLGGVSAMLLAAIGGTMLFSSPYGFWRTSRYFGVPFKAPAFEWWVPTLRLAVGLVGVAALAEWLTASLTFKAQLAGRGILAGVAGALLFFRFGLDEGVRGELVTRCPARLRPVLPWLVGGASVKNLDQR